MTVLHQLLRSFAAFGTRPAFLCLVSTSCQSTHMLRDQTGLSIARITRSQPLFTPTLTRKPSRRRSCPTWTLYPRALGAMKSKCDTIPKHQSSNLTILRLDLVMRSLPSLSLVIAQLCQARLSALSNKMTKSAYSCKIHHRNHIFST
jgi:hypothetical protein